MLFIVIALLVFITQFLLHHWWLVIIDAFIAAVLLGRKSWGSFLSGFFAVGLVWFGMAWFLNYRNEGLLAGKIIQLFPLSLQSPYWLLFFTALIGGLVGGVSAWSGYSLKALWVRDKS
ncbi:hypothetical protein [Eisenibacter elegans]|jgi:hypothetical protein|uniref:hypothetical protein n=1 Tax=Eisenibacter elegans TaxID=997 RepID=UPI0004123125|nr:hypothetical protein [Eisenibacter elegans]